jgi:hypothetical protein
MAYDNTDWPVPASFIAGLPEPAPLPDDAIGRAIKATWRSEHPDYWSLVYSRYDGLRIDEAMKCIQLGYSSPAHARSDGWTLYPKKQTAPVLMRG